MANNRSKKQSKSQSKVKNGQKSNATLEITAVCIIAISIFFAISIYSESGGVIGNFISSLFIGLFGYFAYLLPVVTIITALYSMFTEKKESLNKKLILVLVLCINICAILHMIFASSADIKFFEYYKYAQENACGGIVGAIIGLPMSTLIGTIGANILFYSILIIVCILLFNISIAKIIKMLVVAISDTFKQIKDKETDDYDNIDNEDDFDNISAHTKVKVDKKKVKQAEEEIKAVEDQFEPMPDLTINTESGREIIRANGEKEFIDAEMTSEPEQEPAPHLSEKEKEQLDSEIAREMESTAAEKNDLILQYTYPDIELLSKPRKNNVPGSSSEELQYNARQLVETLHSFKVDASVVEISQGPTITRYEIKPAEGVKVNQITSLSKDLALALAAEKDVMVAPIPGKTTIGIELANKNRSDVMLRDIIESDEFKNHPSKLAIALGKDISGKPIIMDLAKMPHLLIAGATGAGKSVCINTLVISLLYKADPNEVKLVMVDPKQVELVGYNGIPHLLIPVVTDPKKATGALGWAVKEMTERYSLFAQNNVRNIQGYNELMERNGTPEGKMPSIVILIDEFADLMMVAPGDVENYVCRIAQLARAAGMHLVIATQRPVVKFITGNIKANVPSRISFMVASVRDSQTILDMGGAEKLIGKGDMLYMPVGETKPSRMQCAFVSDSDVKKIVDAVSSDYTPSYDKTVIEQLESEEHYEPDGQDPGDADELLPEAIEMAVDSGTISTSLLQRRFRIGYNRAGSIIDQMEKRGIISGLDGNKPRQVLITREQYNEMLMK